MLSSILLEIILSWETLTMNLTMTDYEFPLQWQQDLYIPGYELLQIRRQYATQYLEAKS